MRRLIWPTHGLCASRRAALERQRPSDRCARRCCRGLRPRRVAGASGVARGLLARLDIRRMALGRMARRTRRAPLAARPFRAAGRGTRLRRGSDEVAGRGMEAGGGGDVVYELLEVPTGGVPIVDQDPQNPTTKSASRTHNRQTRRNTGFTATCCQKAHTHTHSKSQIKDTTTHHAQDTAVWQAGIVALSARASSGNCIAPAFPRPFRSHDAPIYAPAEDAGARLHGDDRRYHQGRRGQGHAGESEVVA